MLAPQTAVTSGMARDVTEQRLDFSGAKLGQRMAHGAGSVSTDGLAPGGMPQSDIGDRQDVGEVESNGHGPVGRGPRGRGPNGGGGGRGSREEGLHVISAEEFVRRFRHGVTRQDLTYRWFIGAGCSASSGVLTAGDAVRSWLKDLKYLETGEDSGVEAWAARRFEGYDPEDPAAVYGSVFHTYLHTDQDRRRELERLTKAAEPGFGYATMAQMMTHEKWGSHAGVTISTNFDDLCADALHLFSQLRPQVFTPESLYRSTPMSQQAPTVIKIFGDAHLPPAEAGGNRPQLPGAVRERIREMVSDSGLIMLGYGGRDVSVLDVLESLPKDAPSGGVYWVNNQPPRGAFAEWMRNRDAIWVKQGDFDLLMYYIRLEFGLGHPKIDRFERILRKYESQYRDLSTRSGMGLSETPAIKDLAEARGAPNLGGSRKLTRRFTPDSQRQRLRESLRAFTKALDRRVNEDETTPLEEEPRKGAAPAEGMRNLLSQARHELGRVQTPTQKGFGFDQPDQQVETPAARDPRQVSPSLGAESSPLDETVEEPDTALNSGAKQDIQEVIDRLDADLATPLMESGADRAGVGAEDEADEHFKKLDRAQAIKRSKARMASAASTAKGGSAAAAQPDQMRLLGDKLKGAAREEADRPRRDATASQRKDALEQSGEKPDGMPLPPDTPRRLSPSEVLLGRHALAAAVERAPRDAALRARQARFLANCARDVAAAEECFEKAHQLSPDNIGLLREYGDFALEHLRDANRAERLLKQAFHQDMRNAETLRAISKFLLRARGDLEEAETCLRLAVELEPSRPAHLIDYAHFLHERRGQREEAETHLRRAADLQPKDPRALAELAIFRIESSLQIDTIDALLSEATRLAADDSLVLLAEAKLSERKGDLDDAEARLRRAIELEPHNLRAQMAYARFLSVRRNDVVAAEMRFKAAIDAAPTAAAPLSAYAEFLDHKGGDAAGSQTRHRKALELEPFNPNVLAAFAEHLGRRDDLLRDADEFFRDALALSPRSAPILRAYARFLELRKKDFDGAEAYLRRAAEVDPNSADALDELAQFLHSVREDAEEAEVFFRRALQIAPERAETLGRFAAFLRDTRRDLEEAEHYYKKAVDRNPRDAYALAGNAQFLLAEGRHKEGLKILHDAFDAAWRMDPASRPQGLMLELWIYRYAHDAGRRDESLRAALALIDAGVRCDGWDMGPTVERAVEAGHPDIDALRDIAEVASDGADPKRLKRLREDDE